MNILFLTLLGFESLEERNIYTDLLREFVRKGHQVCVISPIEKRNHLETHLLSGANTRLLRLKTGNIQQTNVIEKGISTLMIESLFKKAIKKYFSDIRFDLVLYSTPPITFVGAIEYIKKRDGAKTYLLLKDIFPQNAVDIGILSKTGIKGIIYKHFRRQEKKLYRVSDRIGCMSPANVDYVLKNNRGINPDIVEVCPNSCEVIDKSVNEETKRTIREKYNIPLDKKVFVYGGNLGRPQGIPFLIECLKKCETISEAYFLIVGDGTEYHLISEYIERNKPGNVKLLKRLPREDYDTMVGACDVGMIFLDHRFTIPNFPSRLLSYMQAKLPVLAITDMSTDIGKIIVEGGFGWWCESDNGNEFCLLVQKIIKTDNEILPKMGKESFEFLDKNYSVQKNASYIIESMK